MDYRYLRDVLTAHWMIEPYFAAAYQQAFRGMLMGLQVEKDDSPMMYYQDAEHPVATNERESLPSGKAINVISLEGIMTKEDGSCHYGTKSLAKQMLKEDKEDFVIGHVLMINSGGGTASSVPVLAEAIKGCTKPVVAFVDGLMASAAIYAGSYCQHIIANSEDDRVGSIGTMVEILNYPKSANLPDGLISLRIYATESTEKNLEFEEALQGNVELIRQNLLDPVNEKFLAAMRENRPAVKDDQLKGRCYFAKDAVGTLIDEIGPIDRAFEKVKELAAYKPKENQKEDLNKPNNTMKFNRINQIEGCESVETVAGTATVTEAQLTSIEAKLAEAEQKSKDLADAQQTITTLTNTNSKQKTRIDELEQIIEDTDDSIKDAYHNGQQVSDDGSDYKCEDPLKSCLEHIAKFKN